jgi:hypothetical protein
VLLVFARADLTGLRDDERAPVSRGRMMPDSQNDTPRDSRFADIPFAMTNRRIRSIVEKVFRDVQTQSADASAEEEREIRESLRIVCVEARRSGLRAEQLLVLIKDVWSGIPAGISRVQSMYGDERLNYVISTCVDEYYGDYVGDRASERANERAGTQPGEREASP